MLDRKTCLLQVFIERIEAQLELLKQARVLHFQLFLFVSGLRGRFG